MFPRVFMMIYTLLFSRIVYIYDKQQQQQSTNQNVVSSPIAPVYGMNSLSCAPRTVGLNDARDFFIAGQTCGCGAGIISSCRHNILFDCCYVCLFKC